MITKQNYESWFLLYVDNELSASERELVFNFVSKHPELKIEFDSVQQLRVIPDQHVEMPFKESLKSGEFEYLEKRYHVEPDLSIVYPNKKELYRTASVVRFPIFTRFAAAASLVFILGLFWWVSQNEKGIDPFIVKEEQRTVGLPSIIQEDSARPIRSETQQSPVRPTPNRKEVSKPEYVFSAEVDDLPVENREIKTALEQTAVVQVETVDGPQGKSNFSKEVLDAASERLKAVPTVAVAFSASPNMEALIKSSMPQDNEGTLLKGLIRKFSRKVLHEDEDEDVRVIQVANFHIHVKN